MWRACCVGMYPGMVTWGVHMCVKVLVCVRESVCMWRACCVGVGVAMVLVCVCEGGVNSKSLPRGCVGLC